ncbi:16219_t:CDS:1, partial [Acaulospora colombiana]
MFRSEDQELYVKDNENEETITLQDISSQKEEPDNPTDDETPLLPNSSREGSTIIEDNAINDELKKPREGGTLFSSFLNMANSIIGA